MLKVIAKFKKCTTDTQYRYSVAVFLLIEALILTAINSFYLLYSKPLPMYHYLSLMFYVDHPSDRLYELSLYVGYILTIIVGLLLYWWFVLEVVLNRKNAVNLKYYVGLVVLLSNIVIAYMVVVMTSDAVDSLNYGVESSTIDGLGGAIVEPQSLVWTFFLQHLYLLLPIFIVYIHFTILSLLRRKSFAVMHV